MKKARAGALAGLSNLSALLTVLGLGCAEDPSQDSAAASAATGQFAGDDQTTACVPGARTPCTCPSGSPGEQPCEATGVFGACECSAGVEGLTAADASSMQVEEAAPAPDDGLPCEVAQVLSANCWSCHGTELKYGATMPLLTRADIDRASVTNPSISMGEMILERVSNPTKPMPPPGTPMLSAEQVAVLDAWVKSGMPAGEACANADEGAYDGATEPTTGPADCEEYYEFRAHGGQVSGDQTPFVVPSRLDENSGNLYQCFWFELPYEGAPQGLFFEPIIDDDRVVHHWLLYANDGTSGPLPPDGSSSPCNANQAGAYLLAGWAPGTGPAVMPDDVGLLLPSSPNARFLLELHYYNARGIEDAADRSGVRFCTASKNRRIHDAAVHTLGTEGICLEPNQGKEVAGTCDPRDDMGDIHILSVWPHMHTLATHQETMITRASGEVEVLHSSAFTFDSQIAYPVDDVVIHPGDTLSTTCKYQNDTDQRVPYGEQTQEEMCYNFVTAWPAGGLALDPAQQLSGSTPENRCINPLSILSSCNGLGDQPQ